MVYSDNVKINPLPYIIAVFILIILLFLFMSTFIYYYNQYVQCERNPNIWCYNDWQCPGGNPDVPSCSTGHEETGLAECLYGAESALANSCYNPPNTVDTAACPCGFASGVNNCLKSCPNNIADSLTAGNDCNQTVA